MLSEILDALKLLIPEVRGRNATRARSEQEFLNEIVDTCEALVEISDPKSDQATLPRETEGLLRCGLRALYCEGRRASDPHGGAVQRKNLLLGASLRR